MAEFLQLLSPQELVRAERFVFARDKRRFCVARGRLRQILGGYLSCDPKKIVLEKNEYDKPLVSPAQNPLQIQFNVSHSEDLALYAFTRDHALGIDVEFIKAKTDIEGIAQRFFTEREAAIIKSLAGEEQCLAFFLGWTRKEALLKALGLGLSFPLTDCEVALKPGDFPKINSIKKDAEEGAKWKVHSFEPKTNFIAAVVINNSAASFISRELNLV